MDARLLSQLFHELASAHPPTLLRSFGGREQMPREVTVLLVDFCFQCAGFCGS